MKRLTCQPKLKCRKFSFNINKCGFINIKDNVKDFMIQKCNHIFLE